VWRLLDNAQLVRNVRRTLGDRLDATARLQVPNGRYVFGDLAFWDVHDEQYLMIAARPTAELAACRARGEVEPVVGRAGVD
jgi:hypothetical protein